MKRIILSLALLGCSASAFAAPADKIEKPLNTRVDKFNFIVAVGAYNKTCATPPLGELTQALARYTIRDLGDRLDSDFYGLAVDWLSKSITGSWCRETYLHYDDVESKIK